LVSDTKTAVTQAIVYSNDKNSNLGDMAMLRNAGYANIQNTDPWGTVWAYSPAFIDTNSPANQGAIEVCSQGPQGAACPGLPLTNTVPEVTDGSVGYSSVYGSWQGKA
jgi:hypothetical protein